MKTPKNSAVRHKATTGTMVPQGVLFPPSVEGMSGSDGSVVFDKGVIDGSKTVVPTGNIVDVDILNIVDVDILTF